MNDQSMSLKVFVFKHINRTKLKVDALSIYRVSKNYKMTQIQIQICLTAL